MKTKIAFFVALLLSMTSFAQPANDGCAGALPINPNNGCVSGTTINADDTWIGAVGCQGGGNNEDVWYTFTAIQGQLNYTVTTSGPWVGNVEFIIVSATAACTGLTVAGSDCGPSVLTGTVNGLQIGTLYYITISTPSGGTPGNFDLCINNVPAPVAPGQDCTTAAILCNDAPFSQTTSSAGFGTQEINPANSCWGGGGERQSKWFKFTIGCSGTLEFNINPVTSGNDYDWALYNTTTAGCPTTASPTPSELACNWSGCKGSTGITTCPDAIGEPGRVASGAGCGGNPAAWNVQTLNVVAGNTYALLVDNFSTSNDGFSLTFGGACGGGTVIIGPDAAFTFTNPSCGVYNFTKTCQTTNSTFLWTFGDGTTSNLQNPSHTYVTTGTYTTVLEVTDALGCTRTSSATFTVDFPVATATPNPDLVCSGETTSIALTSNVPGTTFSWIATNNLNVTGESLTTQTATTIANTLINASGSSQVVTYTVTPTAAGCTGANLIVLVTVNPTPTISGSGPICITGTVQLTGSGTPNGSTPWVSSNPGVATVSNTGLVTGVSAGTTTISYMDNAGCTVTLNITVNPTATILGNAPVCMGSTLQLTGSGTANAVTPWVSSNLGVATVSNTGLVTPVSAGTTTITYTDNGGCQASVIVTVNPLPTISGNAPICVGATVLLTGSPTPNAVTPWVSSNTGVATVSNAGLVTGVSAGTSTITYTNSFGCQATVLVTVNPLPTISGNAPICVGATVLLTGSATPNAVTPWVSSNTGVATVSNAGLVTGVSAGTSTITYTNSNGCQTTVLVTVNPLPTISGNAPICVGATVLLTGSATPNAVTPWVSSNTGVATVSNAGLVTGVSAGTSTITYTNSNGCQTTVLVTVNPLPTISGNAPICVGATVLLTGSATPNAVTPWVSSNTGVATVSNAGLVTGVSAGTSTITYTNSNGCQTTVLVTVSPIPTISGNAPVCMGSTLQLTGSGTPNAVTPWASSNTGVATVSNTGLVTPVSAGTTTITYTNSGGCQASVIVTVNPLPTISGNAPICVGATVLLTGSATPNAVTPWVSSNTGVATVSNAGLVTGVSAGTSTITYTNSNGCQTTVLVTVNPLPTISGNAPICVGATVLLTGSATPNAVTPWVSSNTGVATVSNAGLVTGVSAGTSTITYTNSNGCQTTVLVTVNPLPTISGNAPICVGATVLLTGSATPNAVTPWVSSNTGVATVSNAGLVTGVSAGTSTITYTNSNGCQTTVLVTVNPLPTISGNAPICVGATVLLTGSATPNAVTPWVSSNTGVATVSNAGLVTGVSAGTSTITYTNSFGCQATVLVTVNPLPTISGNAPICIGATVQLTGSATPNAVTPWVSSNTGVATVSNAGLVTGVSAGTSTITYTNSNGCQTTVVVTVNPLPTISTSQTPLTGCNTNDGIIQVNGGGATGTVNWTGTASGTSGVVTLPFNITLLAAGTYNVTFTSNVTGCTSSVSQQILVNPGAPIINPIANYSACGGSFTLLNSNITGTLTGGQAYYTATGGPTGSGTLIPNGTVYSAPTNITVFAYDANGACSAEQSFTIVVNPLPTISGNAPICVGATVLLTGSATPNAVTPWASSNTGVATVSNAGLVTGVSAGTSTITYTNSNGCQITTVVTVNPLPTISGNAPICVGATVLLTGSATPNAVTPWASSNAGVATVSNAGLVTGVSAGTSTITYTNSNGCQTTVLVTVNALPTISGNAPICVGATVLLTGSATPNAVTPWVSSNTGVATVSNTGLVTGIAAGSATITYTNSNGCQTTVSVTVNALPTISNNAPICIGATVLLTGSATPNAVTPWVSSNTGVATVSNTGLVTGVSAGSATITYTNSNGCQTTVSVTVNPNPTISGNSPICGTSTLQLTGSGTPNGVAPWASSNTGVATVSNSGLVTGVAGGSTTITYTNSSGCQVTAVVVVNALPTINGTSAVCIGDQFQLTGSGTPNATNPWVSSSAGIATVDNSGMLTGIAAGSVTITYTDANGCQNTTTVNVSASPVINPVAAQVACDAYILPVITGSNLTGAVSYWSAAGGTGNQFAVGDPITTSMTVFIYDINGTCSSEESFTVTINTTPTLDLISDTMVCTSYILPAITGTNLSGSEAYYNNSQANGGVLITGPITSTQTVWIYDENGSCSVETSYLVTINTVPTGTISGGASYCEGDAVSNVVVDVTGTPDWTINFTLDGSPQTITGTSSPIVLGNTEGTYVLVNITDGVCSGLISGSETITINSIPAAPFAGTNAEYCSTGNFEGMTASGNGGIFTWYNDPALATALGTGSTFTPLNVDGITTYYVTETINGCEGPASTVQISIVECVVAVPTAFTPNGDNVHDTWQLPNLDSAHPNNIVRVYNRLGNILFESNQGAYNSNEWDGRYKGELMPVGSYYFIIEFNNDEDESLTGTVTIILE